MTKVTYRDENARRVFGGTSIQEVVEDAVSTGRSDVAFGMVDIATDAVRDALDDGDARLHREMANHAETSSSLRVALGLIDSLMTGAEVVLLDVGLPLDQPTTPGRVDPNLGELHRRMSLATHSIRRLAKGEMRRGVTLQREVVAALDERWGADSDD